MSFTVLDQFKLDNPHLIRYFAAADLPVFGDAMRMSVPGSRNADPVFERTVIDRMANSIPGNTIKKFHKTHVNREW